MSLYLLPLIFIFLRSCKLVLIWLFFAKKIPKQIEYPTLSLIQPITRGATHIRKNLLARLNVHYPNTIQHIFVCDKNDEFHIHLCQELKKRFPKQDIHIITIRSKEGEIASKIEKVNRGVAHAKNEVLGFIDDDVELKKTTFLNLVPYLYLPEVGSVFGLAYGVSWKNIWSALNSSFVNSNAFQTYIPITYFTDPFTITGHFYLISKVHFSKASGFQNMHHRFDEDTEISVRLRRLGLKSLQTPIIYKVHNEFDSMNAYFHQLKRWFVFPQVPFVRAASTYQRLISALLNIDVFIPILIIPFLFTSWSTYAFFSAVSVYMFVLFYDHITHTYFYQTSVHTYHLILVPITVFILPLFILYVITIADTKTYWRGQHLLIKDKGLYQVLP